MNWNTFTSAWIVLGLFTSTAHADPKFWLYQKMLQKQQAAREMVVGSESTPSTGKTKKQLSSNFDQTLDHFAPSTSKPRTFKQRYFVDSTYAVGPNAPVFYYLCGESTCSGASDAQNVNTLAKKYKAHRVALEHRYYGQSLPFKSLTAANLKYLSMDQALEDLATFERYAQKNLKMGGKWISVGGSYPGEMSAFYRMKHPELVVGALASSAPVLAKADFFEYDRHVAEVAGPQCLAVMQKVVKDVEAKLHQSDSSAAVRQLFQSAAIKDDVDFLYVIADMGAAAIQYGFQDVFCKTLIDGDAKGQATEAYASAGVDVFSRLGTSAFQDSFQSAESLAPADLRPWMYQSCTEFGFYQTAYSNPSQSARSQQISLQYHNNVCKRLFGIQNQVDTATTNHHYYEKLFDPKVTQIFFTNGSNDPWSILSITDSSLIARNPGLKMFVMNGASHCSDFGMPNTAAISSAQDQFSQLVGAWLSGKFF